SGALYFWGTLTEDPSVSCLSWLAGEQHQAETRQQGGDSGLGHAARVHAGERERVLGLRIGGHRLLVDRRLRRRLVARVGGLRLRLRRRLIARVGGLRLRLRRRLIARVGGLR